VHHWHKPQTQDCLRINTALCSTPLPHTEPFYGSMDFLRDNPSEPVAEETFTHSQLSWSSIIPYLLHPSNTIPNVACKGRQKMTYFKEVKKFGAGNHRQWFEIRRNYNIAFTQTTCTDHTQTVIITDPQQTNRFSVHGCWMFELLYCGS